MKKLIFTAMIFALVAFFSSSMAQLQDSAFYSTLRLKIAEVDSAHPALSTADALAQHGFYGEAVEILKQHAPAADSISKSNSTAAQINNAWRVSCGVDYYQLQDVDTAAMTAEEFRNYRRLTETPLFLWFRGKSILTLNSKIIKEIIPQAYVSDRKASFETAAQLCLPHKIIKLAPSLKAEKRFRQVNAAATPFKLTSADSSDMAGFSLLLTFTKPTQFLSGFSWSIPFFINLEHYRQDRTGYEAVAQYSIKPLIEFFKMSYNFHSSLFTQLDYHDYYRMGSDTLDILTLLTKSETSFKTDKYYILLDFSFITDIFIHALSVEQTHRLSGHFLSQYHLSSKYSLGLRSRYLYEQEQYTHLYNTSTRYLDGSEIIIKPFYEININKALKMTPELLLERRWATIKNGLFLWNERTAIEPGLLIDFFSDKIAASLRSGVRSEFIESIFKYYSDDNIALKASCEFTINPVKILYVMLIADYQYKVYTTTSRVSENFTLSANLTLSF